MAATGELSRTENRAVAGRRQRSAERKWRDRLPPLAAAVGIIVLWFAVVRVFGVPDYILPTPLQVLQTLVEEWAILARNLAPTVMEALSGFVAGNSIAILLAIAFVHNRTVEKAFFPLAVFVNTIPILAIAPILVLIFGNGFTPKIVIAALICFFPTLVNMVRGLESASPATLDLMRTLSANKREVFFKVRLQSSLPFLFAALKIATTTSVVGAIVGEWIGSNFGLGALIIEATYNYRAALLFATVFLAAGLAVTLFALVTLAERLLITWKPAANH